MSFDFEVQGPGASLPAPQVPDAGPVSSAMVAVTHGDGVTLWCALDAEQDTEAVRQIRLAPDRPAVVGRAEGNEVPYLDPAYRATRLVPGTGQNIMRSAGHGKDHYVSRGHFMLKAAADGILLVNGVPRTGGSIRAPRNGTRLLSPEPRPMTPGEEYLIESGATVIIVLPNDSEVRISAE